MLKSVDSKALINNVHICREYSENEYKWNNLVIGEKMVFVNKIPLFCQKL